MFSFFRHQFSAASRKFVQHRYSDSTSTYSLLISLSSHSSQNNNSLFSPESITLAYRPSLCSPFSTNQPTAIAACSFHPHNKGPKFTSQQQRKKKRTTATPSIQSESGGLSKLDPHNVESQAHVFSKLRISQSHAHTSTHSLSYFQPYHLCRLLFCIYSATIFAVSFSLLQQRPSSQTLSLAFPAQPPFAEKSRRDPVSYASTY